MSDEAPSSSTDVPEASSSSQAPFVTHQVSKNSPSNRHLKLLLAFRTCVVCWSVKHYDCLLKALLHAKRLRICQHIGTCCRLQSWIQWQAWLSDMVSRYVPAPSRSFHVGELRPCPYSTMLAPDEDLYGFLQVADIKRANGLLSDSAMFAKDKLLIPTKAMPPMG